MRHIAYESYVLYEVVPLDEGRQRSTADLHDGLQLGRLSCT